MDLAPKNKTLLTRIKIERENIVDPDPSTKHYGYGLKKQHIMNPDPKYNK